MSKQLTIVELIGRIVTEAKLNSITWVRAVLLAAKLADSFEELLVASVHTNWIIWIGDSFGGNTLQRIFRKFFNETKLRPTKEKKFCLI